jgi:hypothetical protein
LFLTLLSSRAGMSSVTNRRLPPPPPIEAPAAPAAPTPAPAPTK